MKATTYLFGMDSMTEAILLSGARQPDASPVPRSVLKALRIDERSVNSSVPGCMSLAIVVPHTTTAQCDQWARLWSGFKVVRLPILSQQQAWFFLLYGS